MTDTPYLLDGRPLLVGLILLVAPRVAVGDRRSGFDQVGFQPDEVRS